MNPMQLHQLKPNKKKSKKRIGRGGCHGTYATRGIKGQKSRSGGGKGRSFEGTKMPLFRRTPKMRGFKSIYSKNNIVNISELEKRFQDGDVISPKLLLENKLISKIKPRVKILGNGKLTKKLIVTDCIVSKTAEKKIKKSGGETRTHTNI
jgi:large subunit ribosomal protein L15